MIVAQKRPRAQSKPDANALADVRALKLPRHVAAGSVHEQAPFPTSCAAPQQKTIEPQGTVTPIHRRVTLAVGSAAEGDEAATTWDVTDGVLLPQIDSDELAFAAPAAEEAVPAAPFPGRASLQAAIRDNDLLAFQRHIAAGAPINCVEYATSWSPCGTPGFVRLLLAAGANPNSGDDGYCNSAPVYRAIELREISLLRTLVEFGGATLSHRSDIKGKHPLAFAVKVYQERLVQLQGKGTKLSDFTLEDDIEIEFFRPGTAAEVLSYLLDQCRGWAAYACPQAVSDAEELIKQLGRAAAAAQGTHEDVVRRM